MGSRGARDTELVAKFRFGHLVRHTEELATSFKDLTPWPTCCVTDVIYSRRECKRYLRDELDIGVVAESAVRLLRSLHCVGRLDRELRIGPGKAEDELEYVVVFARQYNATKFVLSIIAHAERGAGVA